MPNGDEKILAQVKQFLDVQKLDYTESEHQNCTRLTVTKGLRKNYFDVYNTGTMKVSGKTGSKLHSLLEDLKQAIAEGEPLPGVALPMEIEKWPAVITEKVPDVDDVIVAFLREAVEAYRVDALLASTFMLGAASEKAICLLTESYANAISDEQKKEKFKGRINGKMISRRYDEFIRSFKSAKTQPTGGDVGNDIETVIGQMFQFCRLVRNEIGHPEAVPDLDKGVVLVNIGHFVGYIERIYKLKTFFDANPIEV